MKDISILGAGIAGLGAAFHFKQEDDMGGLSEANESLELTIV